jgi:hypothetical protein
MLALTIWYSTWWSRAELSRSRTWPFSLWLTPHLWLLATYVSHNTQHLFYLPNPLTMLKTPLPQPHFSTQTWNRPPATVFLEASFHKRTHTRKANLSFGATLDRVLSPSPLILFLSPYATRIFHGFFLSLIGWRWRFQCFDVRLQHWVFAKSCRATWLCTRRQPLWVAHLPRMLFWANRTRRNEKIAGAGNHIAIIGDLSV